jgi:bacteriocin-like protein
MEAIMGKKIRIKIEDLPRELKITEDELKKISGGRIGQFDARLYTGIGKRPPWIYADGPCYDQTFCY